MGLPKYFTALVVLIAALGIITMLHLGSKIKPAMMMHGMPRGFLFSLEGDAPSNASEASRIGAFISSYEARQKAKHASEGDHGIKSPDSSNRAVTDVGTNGKASRDDEETAPAIDADMGSEHQIKQAGTDISKEPLSETVETDTKPNMGGGSPQGDRAASPANKIDGMPYLVDMIKQNASAKCGSQSKKVRWPLYKVTDMLRPTPGQLGAKWYPGYKVLNDTYDWGKGKGLEDADFKKIKFYMYDDGVFDMRRAEACFTKMNHLPPTDQPGWFENLDQRMSIIYREYFPDVTLIHAFRDHPMRTRNPEEASLFVIGFSAAYAYHSHICPLMQEHMNMTAYYAYWQNAVADALNSSVWFQRNGGRDHISLVRRCIVSYWYLSSVYTCGRIERVCTHVYAYAHVCMRVCVCVCVCVCV
jgi:hypothetical protein